jgi:hypothetical protein
MDRDEHQKKLEQFISDNSPNPAITLTMHNNLSAMLYTASELSLFNTDCVSATDAIFCWRIVNAALAKKFPEELRM